MKRVEEWGGWRRMGGATPPITAAVLAFGGLLGIGAAQGSTAPTRGGARPEPVTNEPPATELQEDQRVILITGSTSGLGRELALRLAAGGAHVIVHGRNEERGLEVVREIEEEGSGSATFYRADLASLEEVAAFADQILEDYDRLDVLLNNAGIYLNPEGRILTDDGMELRFQVNYLSHFLLTEKLLPLLERSAPSRIVNVASAAQTALDFDDLTMAEGYSDSRAYAQSKLAQVLFTFELAERLEGTGVRVNALHPATLMNTRMVEAAGAEPRSTVEEGVESVLHLVNDEVGTGRYFNRLEPARADEQAYDEEARERLWRISEQLAGLD